MIEVTLLRCKHYSPGMRTKRIVSIFIFFAFKLDDIRFELSLHFSSSSTVAIVFLHAMQMFKIKTKIQVFAVSKIISNQL